MTSLWFADASAEAGRRPRLLIEDPGAWWFEEFARYRALGFEVAVCTGPEGPGDSCPVMADDACALADAADAVLCALDSPSPSYEIVRALRRRHPELPVAVERAEDSPEHSEAPEVVTLRGPATARERIAAVREAIVGQGAGETAGFSPGRRYAAGG